MPKKIDLTGQKFGRLTVIQIAPKIDAHSRWLCKCDCGGTKATRYQVLVRGEATSCGCWNKEVNLKRSTTHGQNARGKATPTYISWASMIQRCSNPASRIYAKYGAKGIAVCEQWKGAGGFEVFLKDMGERASKDLTLDRIQSSGNYEPNNCRWANKRQQAVNRKSTKFFTLNGETLCIADWARKYNINRRTLTRRLTEKNLTIEQALHEAGITSF